MSAVRELQRSIKTVLKQNRDGSYATQASREKILNHFAEDLVSLGYRVDRIQRLKPKHIEAAVKYWQQSQLAIATIKNRMSALRYICEKTNKANIILSNDNLNIGKRSYTPSKNRAIFNPDFSKISNDYIFISLNLQRVFGLRREESLKIKPHVADKSSHLELLPSWCKGGRGRFIPIRTEEQRYWLDRAKEFIGDYGLSLIPIGKSYIQQREVYDKQVQRAGLDNLHGLRHAYAQLRYKEITGWEAPINGGPTSRVLTEDQKAIDKRARLIITEELGHSREQITVNYLGR